MASNQHLSAADYEIPGPRDFDMTTDAPQVIRQGFNGHLANYPIEAAKNIHDPNADCYCSDCTAGAPGILTD